MDRSSPDQGRSADWGPRGARLARIAASAPLAADRPLLKVIRMSEAAAARLQGAVVTYLWHSLTRAYPAKVFALGPDLVVAHAAEIEALPNRTPNGVVLPRRDTFSSFNLVHQALAAAVEEAGLLAGFALLQMPCNVRVVSGAPDPASEGRSYSSAKMHTDVWNGEPISSILFNIPVLGDPKGVDLRFFEPRLFPESLRGRLADYTLGADVAASVEEYPVPFELGCIYASDSLSLHQTLKRRPVLRVSLDFRAIARELLPGETSGTGESRAVYVPPELWRAGGTDTILVSGEPLDGFQRRRAGEEVRRTVPALFDLDDAPDEA